MVRFESQESIFNMALAYLARIDKLLSKCQEAAIASNAEMWLAYIRGVFRELSPKLTDEEINDIEGDYNEKVDLKTLLDDEITFKEATFKNIYRVYNNLNLRVKYKSIVLFLLDRIEMRIRRQLQVKGMLLPSKSDPRYAVLNR